MVVLHSNTFKCEQSSPHFTAHSGLQGNAFPLSSGAIQPVRGCLFLKMMPGGFF